MCACVWLHSCIPPTSPVHVGYSLQVEGGLAVKLWPIVGVKGVSGRRGCGRRRRRGEGGVDVRTFVWAAGWEGSSLSHKADGADWCGCSQARQVDVSHAAPPSIEDSAAIASKQPEAELQRSVLAHTSPAVHGVVKFRPLKEQDRTSARYQGAPRFGGCVRLPADSELFWRCWVLRDAADLFYHLLKHNHIQHHTLHPTALQGFNILGFHTGHWAKNLKISGFAKRLLQESNIQ